VRSKLSSPYSLAGSAIAVSNRRLICRSAQSGRSARRRAFPLALLRRLKSPKVSSAYGVKKPTTVWTALLVPFTVLCATFFAVIAVFFATCLAVRTGPASTLPMQTANARITENNAFIVLKFRNSGIACAYLHGQLTDWQLPQANRARKYPLAGFSIG